MPDPMAIMHHYEQVAHAMAEAVISRDWGEYDDECGSTREDWEAARQGVLDAYEDDMAEALTVLADLGLITFTEDGECVLPGPQNGSGVQP